MNDPKLHISTPMGIHRVMKEPYDDREVFESIDDLMEYCWFGAAYNGQKVSCIIGTPGSKYSYIQNFTINNNFPIIEMPNGSELITESSSILVYHFRTDPSWHVPMYNKNKDHLNYLNHPSAFSILSLIKVFRKYNQSTYDFTINKWEDNGTLYDSELFSISTDAFENFLFNNNKESLDISSTDNNAQLNIYGDTSNALIRANVKDDDGNNIIYNIIPNIITENNCVSLYVKAQDYIYAMGV